MISESVLLLLPAIVSLIYGEKKDAIIFVIVSVLNAILFLPFFKLKPRSNKIYAKEGFAIVALVWILWALVGALPFYFSGMIKSFTDCFFETVSGFTTTGATILTEISSLPKGMLFWRSLTHWIGGMGVLVFVMAIVSLSDNSMNLMRAEVPGPTVGKLVPRGGKTAKILYGMYIALTFSEVVFLLFGGMNLYDSINHAFATAGTGGFSVKTESIAYYNSAYIEGVISVFMLLFGINFNMYYFIILKNAGAVFKDEELRLYIGMVVVGTALIMANIFHLYDNIAETFRYAFFQVSSVITTTGFVTQDFNLWPQFSRMILLFFMITGCCAGSTGGGFKLARIMILYKFLRHECRNMLNPRTVNQVKVNGKAVPQNVIRGVVACLVIYFIVLVSSVFLVSLGSPDIVTTLTSVITCLGNVGPGLGNVVGPVGNFSTFPDFVKLILSFDMLFGRLEFFPLITLFSPHLWRRKFL